MAKAVTSDYNASSIQVMEGLEAVRRRPGMYIGSTGERGLHVRPEAEKHLHRLGVAVARRDVQRRRAAGPGLY